VKAGKQQVRLSLAEIRYLESVEAYCRIHLRDHFVQTEATLAGMMERLPAGQFLRIHRSYIVRKEAITAFSATTVSVGSTVLPIGRTYQDEVGAHLAEWGGGKGFAG
jgi:DNA-binding LytR/AlgR family response regulator